VPIGEVNPAGLRRLHHVAADGCRKRIRLRDELRYGGLSRNACDAAAGVRYPSETRLRRECEVLTAIPVEIEELQRPHLTVGTREVGVETAVGSSCVPLGWRGEARSRSAACVEARRHADRERRSVGDVSKRDEIRATIAIEVRESDADRVCFLAADCAL